ncbi:NADP oxidoreductase [Actinoplanes sp. N902-109]|nr:NADP oxidoreductase [Actinoplanes sp. N902-109]
MGSAIGARAVAAGHTVEVVGRDAAKAEDLADALGGGATAGSFGTVPAGDIVILAVPNATAVPIVTQYGTALAGKVIVDITNPVNADATGLTTPDGTSAARQIAEAAPPDAHVVKAFNTVFGHALVPGRRLDVLLAADDGPAKASVTTFVESLGLRPLDAGGLEMAHWLEGTGLLLISLANHGIGNFDFALGINALS